MKPTLDKSYSPCSEGYSCVTTRYRDKTSPVDRGSVIDQDGRLAIRVADDGIGGIPKDAPLPALRDRVMSAG